MPINRIKFNRIITVSLLLFQIPFANIAFAESNPVSSNLVPYKTVKEKMSEFINSEMKKSNTVGLSIALVDDQQVVWAQGFGYQDKEKKIPATKNTIYQTGSITKLFTVLATMQLAEQGKLDIDQPLQHYLPDFSIKSRFVNNQPITARTIMTHHSGIASDYAKGMTSQTPYTSLVKDLQNEYVTYPPNYIFSYSNAAMAVLGHTVATVSGKTYQDYIQDEILSPIGMQHSFIANFPSETNLLVSKNYLKGREDKPYSLRDIPAGGLHADVQDMASFMQMLFARGSINGQCIIKPETLAETMQQQNGNIPLDLDFSIGLGWWLSGTTISGYNGKVAAHGGDINHFHSELIILPDVKLGVVVLGNSEEVAQPVREIAKKALELAWTEKSHWNTPINKTTITSSPKIPVNSDLHNYLGYYSMMGQLAQLVNEDGQFLVKMADNSIRLAKNGDGSYSLKVDLLGIIPINVLDGAKLFLHTINGQNMVTYQKNGSQLLVATQIAHLPLPAKCNTLIGGYEIVNRNDLPTLLTDEIIVKIKDGFLTMAFRPDYKSPLVLLPVSDAEWVIAGLGRGVGDTVAFKMVNGEQHLVYSGLEYKKIEYFWSTELETDKPSRK